MVNGWKTKKLGDVAEVCMCKRIFADQTSKTGNIPFYKIGTFGKEADAYIASQLYEEYKAKYSYPEKGDVLISAAGTLGRTVVFDGRPAYFQDSNIVWLRIDKSQLCNDYLAQYYNVIKWASSEGSTISRLYNGIICDTEILIPPLEEQTVIARVLSDADCLISSLQKLIAKKKAIKQGTMQELLTGRIRLVDVDGKEQPKTQILQEKQPQPAHNQYFDDAVMIAGIVNAFYSEKYPLGRKKVQKLLYLVRRKEQADISAFHKKAAGPYADEVRYKGGEPIAQKNKYIQVKRSEKGSRFEKGVQMQQAMAYLQEWGKQADIDCLVSQFQYTSVNELELLATVDMAICDLRREGKEISVTSIKDLIRSNKEWRDKLKKTYFRDSDIQRAIKKCQDLFES